MLILMILSIALSSTTRAQGVSSFRFNAAQSTAKTYQHQFYAQTGWQDEVSLEVNLDGERAIVV